MNEEALKQLYYNIGGEKAVGGSYEQWRDAIRDNNEAKQQLFNNIGGEKAVGGKYELWDSELFGGVKKKETSQPTSPLVLKSSEDAAQQSGILESEFVPSQSNAKVQPEKQPKKGIKDATEEEIKKTLISVGDYTQTKEQRLANIKERIDTEKDKLPTTIKEYLIDYGVKNLYDIGLDDNFNPDKKITRDEIYKFNNYLIQKNNRELKEREAEIDASKYKGVPAWLGMNYLRSLSTGINQGSANLFKRLDGALNMILDAGAMLTNQDDQLENLRKKGYETVFKRAADYIEENKVKPYQDLDPDALQTAVNALGQMNSFFMEMAVPITKTSGATEAILKMPAVMGFDGATETYSELTKSNTPIAEKIKESAVAGGKGAEAGMVFSLMGVGAKMLSQPIKNEYAQVLTEMALNSGGFGAYAGLTMGEKPDDMTDEEWESKRKKEIISNTILGGIMGAKHLPEQLLGASYARAMRTSADNIKKVMDMNIDSRKSEEILKNIVEIDKQLKELEDSPENQNKKIELQLAKDVQSNTLMLNLGAKTIQANPTYVKEKILQSEQSELDKQQQLQKVSEISNMSKQIQEADAVSEQIKTKQKEIDFVESDINNGLGDQITNNSKKTLLEKDIKDLEKQQQEILSRDKTEEILGTSEPRPTEQVTDKVNDIVKQEKPEPTKVNVFGKEMNTYNNFIPEKEQVESEALYSFTSNSKEGIPEILRDKAKLITKATTKINGKTVENETWTANITGEELNKLYEKQSKPEVITTTKEEKVAEITKEEPIKPQENADADRVLQTPEEVNTALKDVESTAKALEKVSNGDFTEVRNRNKEVVAGDRVTYTNPLNGRIEVLKVEKIDIGDGGYKRIVAKNEKSEIKYLQPKEVERIVEYSETPKSISKAYHKAKADGSNPELVKAVEELLSQKKDIKATETKEVNPALKDVESTAKELRKIKDENYDNERIKKIEELTKEPTDEEIYLESQKNERLTEQDKNFSKYTYEKTKEKTKEEDIDMSKITPINTGIFGINSWETKDGVVKVERVNTGYGYSKHASIPNYYKIYYDGKLIAKTDSYITALKYTKDYLDGKEVPKEPNENGKIMLPSDKKSEYRVNKNIESDYIISEQYHKAKADGSNPELVKAVEELLSQKKDIKATETKEVSPTKQKETFNNDIENNGKKIKGITVVDVKDDTITYGNNKTVTNIKIKSKEDAESELKFSKEQLDYEEKQLPKLIKGDEKIQNSLGYSLKEKNDSKKGIADAKKNIEVLKNIVIPFYEKYLKETKSEKPSEGVSPAPVETGLAKSDIVKKYVEEIKTKEDISETKKTEATKKISDGLSEISEIIASKLQAKKGIVEDTDVNFRESLKKVAEGVYDLSVLKAEELIDKVKEVFKKTFEGEQLREVIKQINNNSEEIAALYYEKKGEKLKKTELQKQIDKAVGQTTKLNREYSKLKRDMLFLEKGDNATEAEKYNNFLFKVRDIVSDAKKEGEIDYDIADKILSEIEKTTKFKKELTRESKRIEALVKIENLITENVVSTQHEKLTKDIEKQIGQRLQKQGSKQKGYTIEEWDFKNNVDALLKTKTDLNKANTELEQKLSETTDPKEEANLMEKMMIVDYASRVKEYEDIILNFDKLSLNEKREAITKLTELKEYFKDKTKDFIEKYKEEVQQRAEHKQKLRETSEKGTRRKDYDSKVRLLENVLKNSESKEDILFELISNSDKSVSEKLNKKSQKLLALNDVDFRLELQKILGVKLESKSERDIEDTKSKIFVFHPLKALENLRGLTETVFGIGGKENYKPINEIMDRIDDSPRVMERLDVKMRNMIDNTVDILDKKIKNIRNDKTSKLGISIKGKNGKEAPELYELSYTQVVNIALQMRQDLGYISAVKRYGEEGAMRLQNHVESIIKNTPTLKQYADSVLNFYKENYDAINEVYRKIYKTDMPNIDGYVPLTKISEILETIGMEVGVDGAANKRGTLYVSPSNLNKRKGGGELDISKDAEQVMNNYRKQMSDFVAYAEVKREMIELFTDPQVRANIKSISGGDTYLKYFDLYLNNFPNIQRTDTMVAERLVTWLIRNIVIAPLTLNPKLFFIQAASASNFSTEMVYDAAWKYLPVVNQSLYIKELLKANRWSEYIDQFKDSAFIKHRLQQGFDRDFQAFVNNRFIPTLKSNTNTKKLINELGRIIEKEIKTGAIKAGDIASFLGGMPVYYQQKEILRKENPTMPEDMLRLKAFEKMATLGEKSLQSSYVHLLSPYQLSRVSKLTPYMSNPIQFQQKQFRAIRNLSRGGGSAKEYAQSVNGLLFYSMGTTIIFEAMQAFYNNVILGKQYDDEDENPIQTDEQKKLTGQAIEWIGKGFMQGVPVAGESIEFIGRKLQKKKGFQPEASGTIARANDVLKTTLDITSFLADNYTSKDGFDWDKIPKSKRDKFFKDMRATLECAGWNTKPTEKIIDRIKDGTAYPITLDIYKQAAINRYVKTGNPDMINDLRSKGIITKQVKKAMLKRALKLKEGKDYTDEELENEVKKEKKKELKEEKIKELKLKDND